MCIYITHLSLSMSSDHKDAFNENFNCKCLLIDKMSIFPSFLKVDRISPSTPCWNTSYYIKDKVSKSERILGVQPNPCYLNPSLESSKYKFPELKLMCWFAINQLFLYIFTATLHPSQSMRHIKHSRYLEFESFQSLKGKLGQHLRMKEIET